MSRPLDRTAVLAIIALACVTGCGDGSDGTPSRARRPDIVLVLTDDQRFDALGCAGNPLAMTPNLDRLAREGAYFENALVASPICSPSRASILTGAYGSRTKVLSTGPAPDALAGLPLFPEILQRQGYRTAFIGKWHLPNPGAQPSRGFDHWVSFEGQGRYTNQPLNVDGEVVPSEGHLADVLTSYAVRWLQSAGDEPRFLLLSFKNPHFPYEPAARHVDSAKGLAVALPDSMSEPRESQPEFIRRVRASPRMVRLPEQSADLERTIRRYHETMRSVDDAVGVLLDTLDDAGHLETACVTFTSDNGILLGEHGLTQKNRSYEESIRVPLLVRYPAAVRAGLRVVQPALNVDLAPTILELAGAAIPETVQGRSLLPLLRGEAPPWRDATLHIEPPPSGNAEPAAVSLRTTRWKYVRYRIGTVEEVLFDRETDPRETKNVAGLASSAAVLADLRTRARAEMRAQGCPETWWEAAAAVGTDDD